MDMTDNAWFVTLTVLYGGVIGLRIHWWRQARRTVEPDINEEWFALLDNQPTNQGDKP
jgi:hypothetical protein